MKFLHLFTLLFVYLKLTAVINWSWWYVLAPSYVPAAILLGLAGLCFAGAGVCWLKMTKQERLNYKVAETAQKLADAIRRRG
jgi:hypothetical protein